MHKPELIKKIQRLEQEVSAASTINKKVLDAHQSMSTELTHYVREQEDRLRNLKEEFMLQVQALRQDAAKCTNEYRQELYNLRTQWAKTFVFTEKEVPAALSVPETL